MPIVEQSGGGSGGSQPVTVESKAFAYTDFGAGGGANPIKVCDLPDGASVVAYWPVMTTAFNGDSPVLQFGVAPASSLASGSDLGGSFDATFTDVEGTFAVSAIPAVPGSIQALSLGAAAVVVYAVWGVTPPSQGVGIAYALIHTPA